MNSKKLIAIPTDSGYTIRNEKGELLKSEIIPGTIDVIAYIALCSAMYLGFKNSISCVQIKSSTAIDWAINGFDKIEMVPKKEFIPTLNRLFAAIKWRMKLRLAGNKQGFFSEDFKNYVFLEEIR